MSRFRALLVVTAFLTMACNQSSGRETPLPTLGPLPSFAGPSASAAASAPALPSIAPSATASASATPSPSPSSSPTPTPTPTDTASPSATVQPSPSASEEPSPTASDLGDTGPTSQAALFATFLRGADLPPDAQGGDLKLQTPGTESSAFTANNGIREASATWSSSQFTSLFDIRFQFPTADDAAAFLDAEEAALSESSSGLKKYDASVANADDIRAYRGTISVLGITTRNYNFLIRVGNFVGKVFIAGDDTLGAQVAEGFAIDAAARMIAAVNSGPLPSPTESVEPSALHVWTGDPPIESEVLVLGHVPAGLWDTCESTEQRWGGEVDAVFCSTDRFDATYATFLAKDVLQAAYALDVAAAKTNGRSVTHRDCTKPPAETTWSAGGRDGRVLCSEYDDYGTLHRVIEWTEETGLLVGYMTSTELAWPELLASWERVRATS